MSNPGPWVPACLGEARLVRRRIAAGFEHKRFRGSLHCCRSRRDRRRLVACVDQEPILGGRRPNAMQTLTRGG
jgi:hypothetical protein